MSDFAIAFRGLRTQAVVHGVDPNTHEMRAFLVHTAEVMAQQHKEARDAMKYLHLHEQRVGQNVDELI